MKKFKQLDLFAQSDLIDTTISADQYQLQHAHPNILKKPLDEVPAGGKKSRKNGSKMSYTTFKQELSKLRQH